MAAGGARAALLAAARDAVVADGFAATSARTIATRAGVAPGLIYYHFDDLPTLLAESAREVSAERAAAWAEELATAASLAEVVRTARGLHEVEQREGQLVLLGQLLAGARGNEVLADALRANFDLLAGVVETTLVRVLDGTPLDEVLDPRRLARTVAAAFLGIELFEQTLLGGQDALDQLEVLAVLADDVLRLGAFTRPWVRRRVARIERDVTPRGEGGA